MYLVNIDSIIRSTLISQGLSIHYYYQFLHYAISGFKELQFDSLKIIQVRELTVTNGNSVKLPDDFIDIVKIGYRVGQFTKELDKRDTISRIPNRNATGNEISYDNIESSNSYPNLWNGGYPMGEHVGRMYGYGNGIQDNSYKLVPERNEIRLDVTFAKGDKVLLEYIGYGGNMNTLTLVTAYAQEAIENYILWKWKSSIRNLTISEKQIAQQDFYNSLRILRGRMNSISVNDIIAIARKNYMAAIKN
jgi:hypothetical protein